jgi:NADH pyrophosphatase NudC (nudix superfamily)
MTDMGKFDGILDDVIVNAKAAASVVSKKASDVYDNSKQKIVAAEIRAEINTKLKELGALTYKSVVHGTDLSDKIKEKSAEITELKENLDLINDSISATKSVTYCGSDVPENSKFCNSCGAKLDEDKAQL